MTIRNCFLLAAFLAAPAFATEPPPAANGSPVADATAKDEGVICERVAEPGSLARKRKICTTRAEREQALQNNKDMLEDMSRRVATDKSD